MVSRSALNGGPSELRLILNWKRFELKKINVELTKGCQFVYYHVLQSSLIFSDYVPIDFSHSLKVPKTGLPGRMTSSRDRFSLIPKINMAPFPPACVLFPTATPSSRDTTNIVAVNNTGYRIDIIAS
jgi:hypothetical protein